MSGENWVEKARLFAHDRLAPLSEGIEREEGIPPEILAEMGRAGFFGLTIPREYGGSAASAQDIAGVIAAVSRANLSVATHLAVHLSVAAAPIASWGTDAQRARYLPRMATGEWLGAFALTEPWAGSDSQHLTSRYASSPDGFVLDGAKTFITNGGRAHVVLVFATRDPALGARGISCFLVDHGTPGFSAPRHLDKMGLRGSETDELLFENCRLPRESLLGKEGEGFKIAMTALEGGRIGIAASSFGAAQAAMDVMQSHVGPDDEDWKKRALARGYVDMEAAGALVERAARLKDQGADYGMAASAAKLYASQAAFRIANAAVDVAGPGAAGRLFRDTRVLTIVEGTTEIQEFILGRRLAQADLPSRRSPAR